VCAKRFIVSAAIAERFTELFVQGARKLVVGDPAQSGTELGPLARGDLREALQSQVERSVAAGATLLVGGQPKPGNGYFFEPTVVANAGPGMAVFDEETFGPVAAIAVAKDDADAIRLANATPFGLSLSIWTGETERGVRLAKRITSGAAFINAVTASDARMPFGGTKKSGYGRELAAAGVREFCNIRTFWAKA
jgi:acyl-CoA reductase-like NAD-dependent aldehyde dehydrogenase